MDMLNNPETCACKTCNEWRNVVKSICNRLSLDYTKVTKNDKIELYRTFVYTDKQHIDHDWNIIKPAYVYAIK
jgi:hypothetical protein